MCCRIITSLKVELKLNKKSPGISRRFLKIRGLFLKYREIVYPIWSLTQILFRELYSIQFLPLAIHYHKLKSSLGWPNWIADMCNCRLWVCHSQKLSLPYSPNLFVVRLQQIGR